MTNYGKRQNTNTRSESNWRKIFKIFRNSSSFNNYNIRNIYNIFFVKLFNNLLFWTQKNSNGNDLLTSQKNNNNNTSKLDSINNSITSNILSTNIPNIEIFGDNYCEKFGDKDRERQTNYGRKTSIRNGKIRNCTNKETTGIKMSEMPVFTLKPYEMIILTFAVSQKRPRINYSIISEYNVKVYLMDNEALDKLKKENIFESFVEVYSETLHEEDIKLPCGGKWYIVVSNPTKNTVAVSYMVHTG